MVVAEYSDFGRAFRNILIGNYSVRVTYVGSVSRGRMTGFSFQSSQFVFFNVLEQEQPDQNKYVLYSDPELRNPHLFIHDESVIAGGGVRVVKKDERFYTVNQGSDLVRFLKEGLANKRDKFEALEIICRHV